MPYACFKSHFPCINRINKTFIFIYIDWYGLITYRIILGMCVPLLHYVQFSKNFQQFSKSVKFFVHFVTKMYLELAPKADNRVLNVAYMIFQNISIINTQSMEHIFPKMSVDLWKLYIVPFIYKILRVNLFWNMYHHLTICVNSCYKYSTTKIVYLQDKTDYNISSYVHVQLTHYLLKMIIRKLCVSNY